MSNAPHLSPIVVAGDLLFLSGQLAFGGDGRLVGNDIASQTRQTLDNIETMLESRGLSLHHVVKTTVWLVRQEDFAAFNAAYAERFGMHRPARSTVRSDLMLPGALIEIEAIAQRPVPR